MFSDIQLTVALCEGGHPSPFRFFGDHNKDAFFGNNGEDQNLARAGVKVDGWGLGWGENWDSLADNDPCVTDASAAAEVATA